MKSVQRPASAQKTFAAPRRSKVCRSVAAAPLRRSRTSHSHNDPETHSKVAAAASPSSYQGESDQLTMGSVAEGLCALKHALSNSTRTSADVTDGEVRHRPPTSGALDSGHRGEPDKRILECALAAGADTIVTGDHHLLKRKRFRDILIASPRQFLDAATQR